MIYLASPYSDPDPAVRCARFEAVCDYAAVMIRAGHHVYSPIAHSHPIAERGLPGGWPFWAEHNRIMLGRCQSVVVLALPGWEQSWGVQAEVAIANELGLTVTIVNPVGDPGG